MITCEELHDFLMRYVEGDLAGAELKAFKAHMDVCPSCVDYIESYRTCIKLGKTYKECCEQEMPKEVPQGLFEAILKARQKADEDSAGD